MKLVFGVAVFAWLFVTSEVAALPAAAILRGGLEVAERDSAVAAPAPASDSSALARRKTRAVVNGNEIDLPAFITALFNGLANTILATGDAAANTIGATGGLLGNAEGKGPITNSTVFGRQIGEDAGERVGRDLGRNIVELLEAGMQRRSES